MSVTSALVQLLRLEVLKQKQVGFGEIVKVSLHRPSKGSNGRLQIIEQRLPLLADRSVPTPLLISSYLPSVLSYVPEEERGQKRKRELDEEGEEDEDD